MRPAARIAAALMLASALLRPADAAGAAAPHKFYTSLARVEYNAAEKSVEVTLRVFADDLELALRRRAGREVKLEGKGEADRLVPDYLRETFEIKNRDGEVKALDLSWHQAVAARDVEALGRLLAEDYRFDLDARTRLSRAQELAAVGAPDPPFDFGAFKLGEVGVRVEAERATVSGVLTASPPGADKKARLRYFYVRTLARRDGRWQIISSHLVSMAGR